MNIRSRARLLALGLSAGLFVAVTALPATATPIATSTAATAQRPVFDTAATTFARWHRWHHRHVWHRHYGWRRWHRWHRPYGWRRHYGWHRWRR